MTAIDDMVTWAMSQVGKGYSEVPGERCGPNKYDCSGFVYNACTHANIRPPGGISLTCSTTFTQWPDRNSNGNTFVPGGSFLMGDLIYFNNGDGGAQPGHVGISLGDGTMVNALNTQYGVLVCPQNYGGTPMGAIRLPGAVTLTKASLGSIGKDIGGMVGNYLFPGSGAGIGSSLGGLVSTFGNLDKIATKFNDPAFTKRVGKGALAGGIGVVALFIIRGGL